MNSVKEKKMSRQKRTFREKTQEPKGSMAERFLEKRVAEAAFCITSIHWRDRALIEWQ